MLKAILITLLVLFVVLPLLCLTLMMIFYAIVGTAMLRATQAGTIAYVDNEEDMAPIAPDTYAQVLRPDSLQTS